LNIPAEILVKNNQLIIKLPLTNPTGKIRVKRREQNLNYGHPIATKRESFRENDYVEWQISYATENPPEGYKVKDICINNNQIRFELTKLLYEGILLDILSDTDIKEMEMFINNVREEETLEENEQILRKDIFQEVKGGFKKFIEKTPLFIKSNKNKGYFIGIILKHKQGAVGLQDMVYLCVYVTKLKSKNGDSLINRVADTKEFGIWEVTLENKKFILDVVKAFAIASRQHRNDISKILEQVNRKCNR